MIKKINQYLLTHHPLIWNTRVLWVLIANIILYLLFFLAGFATIDAKNVRHYYSIWNVGGFFVMTLSVLCTLLVLILWLVWYLRNNAFKNFYRIGRGHLAREFLLVLLIVFSSVIYFEFFNLGVKTHVRSFSNAAVFGKELNTINRAFAFLPTEKEPYFVYNSCANKGKGLPRYNESITYTGSETDAPNDSSTMLIRQALRRPDAFSYAHYCYVSFPYFSYPGLQTAQELSGLNQALLAGGRADSIRVLLENFEAVCRKYGVEEHLNIPLLAQQPFATPEHKLGALLPTQEKEYQGGEMQVHTYYIETYQLSTAMSFIDECQANPYTDISGTALVPATYCALVLAVFFFVYRRFTRKVFLISVVGVILWSIITGVAGVALRMSDISMPAFLLFLMIAFLGLGLLFLYNKTNRTIAGALISWHLFLAPFAGLLLLSIQSAHVSELRRLAPENESQTWLEKYHPVALWIDDHSYLLATISLVLVVLYITFIVNRWARRWQALPQE
jgi:hypothetical protein